MYYGIESFGALPNKRQLEHLKMGRKAFFHFGVNTFTDLEWGKGVEAESVFNPTDVDCRQWVRKIKAAGFELAILTAKHHDGFCLWPSKHTEHSVKNSPYKNGKGDVVKEFTDACKEYGIKAGIYLSPWDRNAPGWGSAEYNDFYVNQLTELLTNYGEIFEVWWDGAGSQDTPYDWGRWAYCIRNYQPNASIFGSMGATPYVDFRWVGNEAGFAGEPCYPTINASDLYGENVKALNSGVLNGDRFIPAEVDVSSRPGWFFHEEQDNEVKSVEHMVRIWYNSIGRGCMLLMNFPPDRNGLLPERDTNNAILANEYISKMLSVNFAASGVAKSNCERCKECEAQSILIDNDDLFFASSDDAKNVEINIKLPQKKTFNTFTLSEKIELGIRVCGYKVSALVEGKWITLADKKSIGNLAASYFDAVCSDEIKIEFNEFLAPPVIKSFGLHFMEIDPFKEVQVDKSSKNIAKEFIFNDDNVIVTFGGIYPFNTIAFNQCGIWDYAIEAFDGSNFYEIYKGRTENEREVVRLAEPIETAYQIRIKTGARGNDDMDIVVCHEKSI